MIGPASGRLAVTLLLLICQTYVFLTELLVFNSRIKRIAWYQRFRQWAGPFGLALLSAALVAGTFSNPSVATARGISQCNINVDADIAGKGVRVAAFAQVVTLVLVTIVGSFHPRATGAKELGGGLVITSISLAIALIVRLVPGHSLTLADAAIGSMILDGQSMALSIQLCSKETLVSRWQTGIAVLAQILGVSVTTATAATFLNGSLATPDCRCLGVFWWGWIGGCQQASAAVEHSVFWMYSVLRFTSVIQTSFHGLWNTKRFDEAEKDTRDADNDQLKLGGILVNSTYPRFTDIGSARYGEYPATVTFMYAFYAVLSLTSLANAETVLRDLELRPSSSIDSVGQIIGLVVAGATITRAIWLFYFLFRHDKSKSYGLVWPFKIGTSPSTQKPMLVVAKPFEYSPDGIDLGTILRDPHDLDSRFSSKADLPDQFKQVSTSRSVSKATVSHRTMTFFWIAYSVRETLAMTAEELVTKCLADDLNEQFLKECAALSDMRKDFGSGTRRATVYLITRLEIAKNMTVSFEKERSSGTAEKAGLLGQIGVGGTSGKGGVEMGAEAEGGAAVSIERDASAKPLASANVSRSNAETYQFDGERIYTYSVAEYTFARDGAVVK